MLVVIPSPWVCSSCRHILQEARQARRLLSTSRSTSGSAAPPTSPPAGFTKLPNRRLIAVHGTDASHFLHGICTSALPRATPSPLGFYSAFLTATGRVLYDAFIYPTSHSRTYRDTISPKILEKYGDDDLGYLIEVDSSQADSLVKHLKRYKLRAKVDIRAVEEGTYDVWNIWDEATEPWTPHPSLSSLSSSLATAGGAHGANGISDLISLVDSRAPGMGRRLVLPAQDQSTSNFPNATSSLLSSDAVAAPPASYIIRRMLRGIPEGPAEIPSGAALPAEHNIDLMSGIDFRKGCYVGQELTIRTHHTGVIRKRILPVMLYNASGSSSDVGKGSAESAATPSPLHGLIYNPQVQLTLPETGADIKPYNRTGRSAGKFVAGLGNIGLGLCRVEMMTDLVLTTESQSGFKPDDEFKVVQTGEVDGDEQMMIKAFVPEWMRGKITVRKPQQRI